MKRREVATVLKLVSKIRFLVTFGPDDRVDDCSSSTGFNFIDHEATLKTHRGGCMLPSSPLRTTLAFIVEPPLSSTTTGSDGIGMWRKVGPAGPCAVLSPQTPAKRPLLYRAPSGGYFV